ncbi:MAG: MotA/TolQ/ExbB proton channel family protein [Gimesia chilikensis]|uniref:MotA/TolQ/ExbB proton channel family protein n=1 Tax=Gimesia chilikensis TaxID=2605989 RepID=UPI0037973772
MAITTEVPLSWSRQDIEQRFAFKGGRYTRVNTLLSILLGVILTVVFYALLIPLEGTFFADMFTRRGFIPYLICFFSFWSLSILFIKYLKLSYQKKSLAYIVVPSDTSFVLSSTTVDTVIDNIYKCVDDPRHFVLFNRIIIALSNLRNLGRVTDVDEILRSQAVHDESSMETSYALLSGFIWAIPVLGFIGTVLGLSQAIGGFGKVLQTSEELSQIKTSLQGVTGGLATAFETTLQALIAALFIQLILTFLKKSEEEFLDSCSEYCITNIVNKLRIMPFETQNDN